MSVLGSMDLTGFAAGALVTASSLPKVTERITKLYRRTAIFNHADLCRDGMQALGNIIWVQVGLWSDLQSMVVFCVLNCLLQTVLVVLNLRSCVRRGRIPDTRKGA